MSENKTTDEILARLKSIEEKIEKVISFNVESLDPDKRSWYYDGDGTIRKKPEE